MLLFLDQSLADAFTDTAPAQQAVVEGLEILGSQIYHGEHALFAPRQVAEVLLDRGPSDRRLRLVLKAALAQYSDRQRLYSRVAVHAEIKVSLLPTPIQTSHGNHITIEVPVSWIDHPDKIRRAALLGEDGSDVAVFREITRGVTPPEYLRAFPLAFDPTHGGGAAIGAVFATLRHQNRLIFCIVDSDRQWPGCQLGNTALQISHHFYPHPPPLAGWLETQGRDLENCLPDPFYTTTYNQSADQQAAAQALAALTNSANEAIRQYVDICDGMVLEQVFALTHASGGRQFWDTSWPILSGLQNLNTTASLPCAAAANCTKPPPPVGQNPKCACRFFPKFNKTVLDRFVEYSSNFNGPALSSQLSTTLRAEWNRLGFSVFDWCCANVPRPV